jgi:hypothetical protein
VPRTGAALSLLAAFGLMLLIFFAANDLPVIGRIAVGLFAALMVLAYGFLVSYVYGDSKRRGMRQVVWTLVAAFVPNALGFIAYFILREPLLQPCGSCGATARRDFAFCPQCGAPLPRVCPSCHRPVELVWTHCAHCGQRLGGESSKATPETPPDSPSSTANDQSPFQEG